MKDFERLKKVERHREERCLFSIDRKKPVSLALAFPNSYRVGMANLGFQGIYRMANEHPLAYAERVFMPSSPRRGKNGGKKGRAPGTYETGGSPASFHMIAFSVSFEEDYANIVRILHDSGIHPLRHKRERSSPLIVVGGTAPMINPAPLLEIADIICLGDGHLLLPVLLELFYANRHRSREQFLEALSAEDGFLVCGFNDGGMKTRRVPGDTETGPEDTGYIRVLREGDTKNCIPVFSSCIAPASEFGARGLIELTRGCTHRCAFCWGGHNCGPFYAFPSRKILDYAEKIRAFADGIGLVSMGATDYPGISALIRALHGRGLSVGLSSLHFKGITESFTRTVMEAGQRTVTLAPEAGTESMRRSIRKDITDEQILEKTDLLFLNGLRNLKLYFMIGLPGEREEDMEGIVRLAGRIREGMITAGRPRGRLGELHVSLNCFVPKPKTGLQNMPMEDMGTLQKKIRFIRKSLSAMSNLHFSAMSPFGAHIQGLLSRGDAGLTPLLLEAGTSDKGWRQAARSLGLNPEEENCRVRDSEENFPWDCLKTTFRTT